MSPATATPVYSASLPMPTTVRGFFDTLREFGTVKGLDGNYDVTLYLPSEDSGGGAALGARILRLGQALGTKGLAPAFPTGPSRYFTGGGTYGWVFGEPVYAGDGQWSIVVPTIDDLRCVLDSVTGLAGFDRSYAGEPVLPVTYHIETRRSGERVMHEDLRTIEDEIESYIGERVCFTDPQPVL
jgi:hypothetical protein